MRIKGKYLTFSERETIERMYTKFPVSQIAAALDCHRSTVYKELKRGFYTALTSELLPVQRYSAVIAQRYHDFHQTAKGAPLKIADNFELANFIEDKIINCKYSPAACVYSWSKLTGTVPFCVSTLYSYIDKGIFLNLTRVNLPEGHYRKKKKHLKIAKRFSKGTSIDKRPLSVLTREEFGHWEIDTLHGKAAGRGQTMLVLTERKTRYELAFKLPDNRSASVISALDNVFEKYDRRIFRSITCDNGMEFTDYERMGYDSLGNYRTSIYYCRPYCSSQRGSNERQNRMLRRWFQKSSDFSLLSQADIDQALIWLNNYPRHILGYLSSADLFSAELSALAA